MLPVESGGASPEQEVEPGREGPDREEDQEQAEVEHRSGQEAEDHGDGDDQADHRFRLPFAFRCFPHRSTSGRIQIGPILSRATGSGKSSRSAHRLTCALDVLKIAAISATPTRSSSRLIYNIVTHRKCPRDAATSGGVAPGQGDLAPVRGEG
jgi:hypothetical protein